VIALAALRCPPPVSEIRKSARLVNYSTPSMFAPVRVCGGAACFACSG